MDSVMKGLTKAIPQNFWARTAPVFFPRHLYVRNAKLICIDDIILIELIHGMTLNISGHLIRSSTSVSSASRWQHVYLHVAIVTFFTKCCVPAMRIDSGTCHVF